MLSDLQLPNDSLNSLGKYADDNSLCAPLFKNCSNDHILKDHNHIVDWSKRNELPLNENKCKSLTISSSKRLHGVTIPGVLDVDELKLLGVIFCSDISRPWKVHIDSIVKRASSRLYCLRILKPFFNVDLLHDVYFGLIRSILEYCSVLFVGTKACDLNRLDMIQRRAHRIMHGGNCNKNCLPTLESRRFTAARKFVTAALNPSNIVNHLLPRKSSSSRNNKTRFLLDSANTKRRLESTIPFTCTYLQ